MPLLEVKDLNAHYKMESGRVKVADDISFNLETGESIGIAGESGCGKTTVIMSLKCLVDHRDIVGGKIILDEQFPLRPDKNCGNSIAKGEGDYFIEQPAGCKFQGRCDRIKDVCRQVQTELVEKSPGHFVACCEE